MTTIDESSASAVRLRPPRSVQRRGHQARRVLREQGAAALAQRVARRMVDRLPWPLEDPLPVNRDDLLAADLTSPRHFNWRRVRAGTPLWVNVIMTPPAIGSGGHTTIFRLVSHLETCGHRVRLYLYDLHGNEASWFAPVIEKGWPEVRATVHDAFHGMGDADAVIATAWPTAYRAYVDPCSGKRFYLVQDYEPWFYPPGSLFGFAEATYRMGFHPITAGDWLAALLGERFDTPADAFDFGSDDRYHLSGDTPGVRRGVVFHARPDTPRRAYELGLTALEIFARRHPAVPITLFGSTTRNVSFPHQSLGVLPPDQLAALYQHSRAGLSLSFTNASLIPHEMLAAGCLPVVNDAPHNRRVLANDYIQYATADPHSLAHALSNIVDDPQGDARAVAASHSVRTRRWEQAGERVREVLERELWW